MTKDETQDGNEERQPPTMPAPNEQDQSANDATTDQRTAGIPFTAAENIRTVNNTKF